MTTETHDVNPGNGADITDVVPLSETTAPTATQSLKEAAPPQQQASASLRSIFQEGKLYVGICLPESIKEDKSFSLSQALVYNDPDTAIAELESTLAHARAVRDQFIAASAYQQAMQDAAKKLQEAANPQPPKQEQNQEAAK